MKNLIIFLSIFFNLLLFAQEYGSALGIKTGYPGFVTLNYKKNLDRVSHNFALDGGAGMNFDRDNPFVMAQLLFEWNKKIGYQYSGFNIYLGLGPTIQNYLSGGYLTDSLVTYDGLFMRGDFVVGIERYIEENSPINIALELGPTYNFYPIPILSYQVAIAIRYGFPEKRKRRI
jgi:hypothetical protein